MMISTDRIREACDDGALRAVRDFYAPSPGADQHWESEPCGAIVQHWVAPGTHFFVVMVDGRCDCLRVWQAGDIWSLSADSQVEVASLDYIGPVGRFRPTADHDEGGLLSRFPA